MTESVLSISGMSIAVYRHGTGEVPLVLLHGGGVDSAMLSWREVMAYMPERYTIYAIDLPGYGNSSRPEGMEGPDFYSKHIAVVEGVVDALGLHRFVLSGLSMGGAIGIGYTLTHPERVAALVPVDSWGLVSRMPMNGLYYWCVNTRALRAAFRLYARHRWLVRWAVETALIGDRQKVTEALVDEVLALCRMPNAEASMRDFQRSSLTRKRAIPDYNGKLSELSMPTLFICGEKDALVTRKVCAAAAKQVRNGRLHIMPGCRHWAQKERPQEYATVVDTFVQEVWRSTAD
ncbi:MAG: alpha/beta hydrolase [Clostridia bacterium]|nr:alpha/beta hydrolase [Clostridia bacterium]